MNIRISVNDHGTLSVAHDGPDDVTVTLENRQLQATRGPIPPGKDAPLPYRIREAELLDPDDWQLGPDTSPPWSVDDPRPARPAFPRPASPYS